MKAGEITQLSVDSLTLEGEGVGRLAERELLCRGVFPDELASVRISALSRQHARGHATLVRLERAHAKRREPPCPNHERRAGQCTGCALMELEESAQREAKRRMLARFGLAVARVEAAPTQLGYRHSSKRVAFRSPRGLTLGSYVRDSHALAAMPGCLVDHPRLEAAFALLEQSARTHAIESYDERTQQGDLRYAWAKTNGDEVIVTLITAEPTTRVHALVPALAEQVAGVLHSVQGARGNALRGRDAELLHGQREVSIQLLGERVDVGALGFVQPNPAVAEAAYRALLRTDANVGRALAFDLYAGAGLTTRALRGSFERVVACEAHPESALALGVAPNTVEHFLREELARSPRRTPDLVIANPPRKGLGAEAARSLNALGAPALHVMSCGPEGLARDLAVLRERYTLSSLEAFDTLPQTPHVELVARLALKA